MLKAKTFQGTKGGFFTPRRSGLVLKTAVDAATEWINEHDAQIEVRHISVGQDQIAVHVVVWYVENPHEQAN
jgi:hypothetical protein